MERDATAARDSNPAAPARAGAEPKGSPWIVFSDDWGRHPSSCQHLIRQALTEHAVDWVNMIGTRRPRLDLATLRRGLEKFGQWRRPALAPGAEPDANPRVLSPRIWPGFRYGWERRLNRAWLSRQLAPAVAAWSSPAIAITTMPTAADLVGVLPVRHWVYYCVDDFSTWPGIDQRAARELEDRLIDTADVIITVSDTLSERVRGRGREPHLLTHGVDLEFWRRPATAAERAALPAPMDEPWVLFWGLVDPRMDGEFVRALSARMTVGTILLVGPEDHPDPALTRWPRVRRLGGVPAETLRALAQHAAVLIMPYRDAPVTRAMQPLKLKEYLATDRPAVVRDLPANRPWADALDLAATPEVFAERVLERIATGLPPEQALARRRLEHESWSAKARAFARLVERT